MWWKGLSTVNQNQVETTFNTVFHHENKPDFLLSLLTGMGGWYIGIPKVPEVQGRVWGLGKRRLYHSYASGEAGGRVGQV